MADRILRFAPSQRPASPAFRILLVSVIVPLFFLLPLGWATVIGLVLTIGALLLEPSITDGRVLLIIIIFGLGFVATVPGVYTILWLSQHSVGRVAILPALFGLALVAFVLGWAVMRIGAKSNAGRLVEWALFGAGTSLLLGGLLSVIFWDAFAT